MVSMDRKKKYAKPSLVARGNILVVTKNSGLLPGDNGMTSIDPGSSS